MKKTQISTNATGVVLRIVSAILIALTCAFVVYLVLCSENI